MLYVTHRLSEVIRMADRITILETESASACFCAARSRAHDIVRLMTKDVATTGRATRTQRDLRGSQSGSEQPPQTDSNPRTFVRTEIYASKPSPLRPAGSLASPAFRAPVTAIFFARLPASTPQTAARSFSTVITLPLGSVRHAVRKEFCWYRRTGAAPRLSLLSRCAPISASAIGCAARCAALGFAGRGEERGMAQYYIDRLSVRPPYAETRIGALSGGNQQKVAIARALEGDARVLLIEEPTQGVDVARESRNSFAAPARRGRKGLHCHHCDVRVRRTHRPGRRHPRDARRPHGCEFPGIRSDLPPHPGECPVLSSKQQARARSAFASSLGKRLHDSSAGD